jgi:hypothetical protein
MIREKVVEIAFGSLCLLNAEIKYIIRIIPKLSCEFKLNLTYQTQRSKCYECALVEGKNRVYNGFESLKTRCK